MSRRSSTFRTIAIPFAATVLVSMTCVGCARSSCATWAQTAPAIRPQSASAASANATPRYRASQRIELADRERSDGDTARP